MTLDPFFLPRLAPIAHPPTIHDDWALFLDLDGTLVDIAPTPQSVVVPPKLVRTLQQASARLGGALAIVSGRLLEEVDRLLAPLKLPGAGEHGAVIRMPDGAHDEIDLRAPQAWIDSLIEAAAAMPKVLIERKTHGVVAHYRRSPDCAEKLRSLAFELVASDPASFEILEAKMAIEIRPRTVTKARAVTRLMGAAPFAGRVPVFVGDDLTDRDGFRAVEKLGGQGFSVLDQTWFHRNLRIADAEEAAVRHDDRVNVRILSQDEIRDRTDASLLHILDRRSDQLLARDRARQRGRQDHVLLRFARHFIERVRGRLPGFVGAFLERLPTLGQRIRGLRGPGRGQVLRRLLGRVARQHHRR